MGQPGPDQRPRVRRANHTIELTDPALADFWSQRYLVTMTTLRADGRPHVVPVGATLDVSAGIARVIASGDSVKVKNLRRGSQQGPPATAVVLCQVDGRRWTSIEGFGRVCAGAAEVAEAERRYAQRYRQPRVNDKRVAVEIDITRVLGNLH